MSRRNVAILIFDDVEILDFAGPYEVFATTRQDDPEPPFFVYTVAEKSGPVSARNGLSVNPRYSIYDCPNPDIVLVPGGRGWRTIICNQAVLDWIKKVNGVTDLTLSVCTGALVLGKAGLLDGLAATTYHTAFEELKAVAPNTVQRPTSAGSITAGSSPRRASRQASTCRCTSSASCSARRRPTRRPTTWSMSTGTVCRWKNRNERRETRNEKKRRVNFPIVDGA